MVHEVNDHQLDGDRGRRRGLGDRLHAPAKQLRGGGSGLRPGSRGTRRARLATPLGPPVIALPRNSRRGAADPAPRSWVSLSIGWRRTLLDFPEKSVKSREEPLNLPSRGSGLLHVLTYTVDPQRCRVFFAVLPFHRVPPHSGIQATPPGLPGPSLPGQNRPPGKRRPTYDPTYSQQFYEEHGHPPRYFLARDHLDRIRIGSG